MNSMTVRFLVALLGAVLPLHAVAQQGSRSTEASWDVTAIHGPGEYIEFTTDEGTWISLDVSPSGDQIVFDLLGDIFLMPISKNEATLLLGGPAYETQPR